MLLINYEEGRCQNGEKSLIVLITRDKSGWTLDDKRFKNQFVF